MEVELGLVLLCQNKSSISTLKMKPGSHSKPQKNYAEKQRGRGHKNDLNKEN